MTAGRWPRQKLGKLVDVKGGKRLPAGAAFSTLPTDHPYIRGQDIRNGRIRIGEPLFVTDEVFQKIRRYTVDAGAVCITIVGNIGDVGITPAELAGANLTENAVKLIPLIRDLDRRYLAYALLSPSAQEQMKLSAAGAAQPKLGIYKVNEIEVPVPDAESQRRIASILSAYDDLIENNTRRIAILEEMARRIYEEWFVRFRFPGYENVRMVESELGLVPEGWPIVAASAAIHVNPQTKVAKDGLKPFVAMNCLADGSMLIDAPEQRSGNSGSKFRNNDTLFARITPCLENGKTGYVQFLPDDESVAFGSTEFIVLRSRTLTPEFVYLLARSAPFRDNAIKSMSGASGRQRVRDACFDTFLLPQPDTETLRSFAEKVKPMFRLIQTLAIKNANLRTTRDLLLPKLISGELDVSAMPEPEAAAA